MNFEEWKKWKESQPIGYTCDYRVCKLTGLMCPYNSTSCPFPDNCIEIIIKDAKAKMEDGFSLKDFNCEDSEVDDIYPKDKQ